MCDDFSYFADIGKKKKKGTANICSIKMLYDQDKLSIIDTYQQKQLAIENHMFIKWSIIIQQGDMMQSIHLNIEILKAEYELFFNWEEPDSYTWEPMRRYKPKKPRVRAHRPEAHIPGLVE